MHVGECGYEYTYRFYSHIYDPQNEKKNHNVAEVITRDSVSFIYRTLWHIKKRVWEIWLFSLYFLSNHEKFSIILFLVLFCEHWDSLRKWIARFNPLLLLKVNCWGPRIQKVYSLKCNSLSFRKTRNMMLFFLVSTMISSEYSFCNILSLRILTNKSGLLFIYTPWNSLCAFCPRRKVLKKLSCARHLIYIAFLN